MKTFAKRIAFVLVFAMVVTLTSHAANNSYAANTLKYGYKKDADTVTQTSIKVYVGDTAEVKFIGAGSDWNSLFKGWKTSNSKIVTVSDEGVVTGVAVGTAQVYADLGTNYTGKLTVVVEERKSYKVEQLSETLLKVDLGDKDATARGLADKFTFSYNIRENTAIKYPAKVLEVKNGIATIRLYSYLKDGKTYTVSYNGLQGRFVASVGTPDYIELKDNTDKCFIEKDEENCEVTITPIIRDEKGVDITETAFGREDAEIVYEILDDGSETAELSNISINDDNTGALTLARGTVKVKAYFYDGTYSQSEDGSDGKTLSAIGTKEIVSKDRPEFEIKDRLSTTISSEVLDLKSEWKNELDICVGDDKASGETLRLQALYSNNSKDEKILTTDAAKYGNFRFESTDVSKLFVREDGTLFVYDAGYEKGTKGTKVQVLVFFTSNEEDAEEEIVDVIDVNVKPKRALSASNTLLFSTDNEVKINGMASESGDVAEVAESETMYRANVIFRDQYGKMMYVDRTDFTSEDIVLETKCSPEVVVPKVKVNINGALSDDEDSSPIFLIKIQANDKSIPNGNKDSQDFKYKVKIGEEYKTISIKVKSATKGQSDKPAGSATYEIVWINEADTAEDPILRNGKFDCRSFCMGTRLMGGSLVGLFVKRQNGVIVEQLPVGTFNYFDTSDEEFVEYTTSEKDIIGHLKSMDDEDKQMLADTQYGIVTMSKKNKNSDGEYNTYTATDGLLWVSFWDAYDEYGNPSAMTGTPGQLRYADNGGIGTYVYNVYQVVAKSPKGAADTTSYAVKSIGKKNATLEVTNSTSFFTGGERTDIISVDAMVGGELAEWQENVVTNCFKFSFYNGTKTVYFEKPADYEAYPGLSIEVKGNGPANPSSGDIYYIDEVTFNMPIGVTTTDEYLMNEYEYMIRTGNAPVLSYDGTPAPYYFSSKVKVNKYVTVK